MTSVRGEKLARACLAYLQDPTRESFYKDWLRRLVQHNSYTQDPAAIRRQAELTADFFSSLDIAHEDAESDSGESQRIHKKRSIQAHFIDSESSLYGPHLSIRVSEQHQSSVATNPRPTIGLVSHLDTVYPDNVLERHGFQWMDYAHDDAAGNRVLGPGTMDIKGGTVVMHMALNAMRAISPSSCKSVDFVVLLDAAEEENAIDFADVAAAQLGDPRYCLACLVFEAGLITSDNRAKVVTSRKGRCIWEVVSRGIEGHAGNAHHTSRNAITQLCKTLLAISDVTDYSTGVTVNVGTIRGGKGVNSVPGEAVAEVEMRAATPVAFARAAAAIEALGSTSGDHTDEPYVTIHRRLTLPVWGAGSSGSTRLLRAYERAAKDLGYVVEAEARGGGSDGNWLWDRYDVVDGLGPSGYHAHCSAPPPVDATHAALPGSHQEFAEWKSFAPKAAMTAAVLLELVHAAQGTRAPHA
eukprot:m.8253 g.8253  ORF g.8253 m.8253 type:complete len:468 (+) comp6149_c0_seq1:289-1692(+)